MYQWSNVIRVIDKERKIDRKKKERKKERKKEKRKKVFLTITVNLP